jgi:hypothetical protein
LAVQYSFDIKPEEYTMLITQLNCWLIESQNYRLIVHQAVAMGVAMGAPDKWKKKEIRR